MTDITTLMDELTLDEQVSLMAGQDMWNVGGIERLGIGALRVTDGPNGARGGGDFVHGTHSAAFPVGIALGATWDPDLMHQIGGALALETRDKGASVLLGPTINLQRGPLNGRNFECYSEDPVLTAKLTVSYVQGLQAAGVAATLKHFVANESEIRRTVNSSDADERTLRELYLVPFERAVKEAGAWAIMSAYNRINGTYAADNRWLLTEVLRGDWGFDGLVMSDWFGLRSTVDGAIAGLDLEMPGPTIQRGDKLVEAVRRGDVPAELVRQAALNVLRLLERTGTLRDTTPRREVENERPETRALIREAGVQSAVLLKNDGALPLSDSARIAVIGPNARTARVMGGGSAQLNAYRMVSPWDGLAQVLPEDRLSYAEGCTNERFSPVLEGDFTREWFKGDLSGDPVATDTVHALHAFMADGPEGIDPLDHAVRITGRFTAPEAGTWRFGFHSAGRSRLFLDGEEVAEAWDSWARGRTFFEEGCDPVTVERDLGAGQSIEIAFEFATHPTHDLHVSGYHLGVGRVLGQAEIDRAADIAAEADVALVCVGRSAEWDTEGWDLPDMTLPGLQDRLVEAVAARAPRTIVLLQTGGPVAMPWLDRVDAVLQGWYPGQEAGQAFADVLTGARSPGGRLPQSFPTRLDDALTFSGTPEVTYPGEDGHVRYDEGLYIGYRHHARSRPAAFPFGFGLGYTDFAFGKPEVRVKPDGTGDLRLTVTNTGAREGAAVVQLYIAPAAAPVDRPEAELKNFAKLSLAPGDSGIATLALAARDFAWFDGDRRCWAIAPGEYTLRLGTSATDIFATAAVHLEGRDLPL
ncbi:glycoside hydrolase family 3 C-terminal domain-containing protein [Palleronia sp.]|uniref:beta-glucosidase n=1 Tax=Palleronia sp. TaxID=1940284 RepID=UPI0035C7B345